MSKTAETRGRNIRVTTLTGESSAADKAALICDLIMLGIFGWNQLFYGMDMLFLIVPLALVGAYLLVFCIIAEEYHFTGDALEIRHKFKRTVVIHYDCVFNYEACAQDLFVNITQNNKVKLYHTQAGKKRCTLCTPKDVASFVDALKWNCPEFHEEPRETSRLDVFFNTKE